MCHQLTVIKLFTWKRGDSVLFSDQQLVLKKIKQNREMTELVHVWHNISYLVPLLILDICLENSEDALFSLFTRRKAFLSHLTPHSCTILPQAPHLILHRSPWLPSICHTFAVKNVWWEITDDWHWKELHLCNRTYTAQTQTAAFWCLCYYLHLPFLTTWGTGERAVDTQAHCLQMISPEPQSCSSFLRLAVRFKDSVWLRMIYKEEIAEASNRKSNYEK